MLKIEQAQLDALKAQSPEVVAGCQQEGAKRPQLLPAMARAPVEMLANQVQDLPNKGPTIEQARPSTVARMITQTGKEIAGRSKFADKQLHPLLQKALDNIPLPNRAPPTQHGRCAEINTIDKALKSGETLAGSRIQTAKVKKAGNRLHGMPDAPCPTCAAVLKELGVTYDS